MAEHPAGLVNLVRDRRLARGWSQGELARRSGLSRAGVSAVETGRQVPSAAAALALAAAFGGRVEDLFALARPGGRPDDPPAWAWDPPRFPCRYWRAEVGGRVRLYPAEATALGVVPHDGVAAGPGADAEADPGDDRAAGADPRSTLVLASCDPAAGLLADALAGSAGVRLLAVPRSSRAALDLLRRGLVHVAGVHLATAGAAGGNAAEVREALGPGAAVLLLRGASWEEGVAVTPGRRIGSVDAAVRAGLRWVGREPGSGARRCLDELLGDRRPPRRLAHDHRGVAQAVRDGWADAGVCLRLAGEEAGLDVLSVRSEAYDYCVPEALRQDPRVAALIRVVRSPAYRRLLAALPGYDASATGGVDRVARD